MPNTDSVSLVDGNTYRLCAEISDAAGNKAYGTSANFTTDYGAPSISAVALAAVVSDGYLTAADSTAATDTVASVTASGQDAISYAVATSSTTCDASLVYASSIPKTNNSGFTAEGSWKVCVKATDTAANAPAYSASVAFTRDTVLPTSTVSTTGTITQATVAGTTTTISGTAADSSTGVSSVSISIKEGSGNCYDSAAHDFTATCPNWVSVTGTTSWSRDFGDSEFLRGIIYTVSAKATDGAGQAQTTYGTNTFTWSVSEASNAWNKDFVYDQSSGDDKPLAGAVDSDGNLYAVGYHTGSDKNWLIKKYSKRGFEDTVNWNKDVGDSGTDEIARSVAVDSSGNVIVAGSRWNGSDWDWMIKKYNSAGVEDTSNWDMLVDSGNGDDEALGVAADSSGNVYVVGYGRDLAGGSTGEDIWVKKFQSNGTLSCEQKLDEGAASLSDRALAVAVNNSSSKVYIAGFKTVTGPDKQLVVKRLRMSDCSIESTATGNSAGSGDFAAAIRLDSSGNVYVTGTNTTTDKDWWIRKYSSTLTQQADFSTGISGNHEANTIAVDSNGKVYVGGYKTVSTQDLWLRQFNSSLVENTSSWDLVIDGSGSADQVTAVVISGGSNDANNVYMIGYGSNKIGGSSGADWWIRKYAGP
jgi:hypothetical protein